MSILSFIPSTASATIPSHLSSSSIRMAPVLDHKNTSLTVANWEISSHRDPESYPTVELNAAVRLAEKHIPSVPHWRFSYLIIRKVFVYGAFLIHRLDPDLRDAVCILSLVCIALDTIEDDTSMDTEVKTPILMAFHRHIYDREWHFACGTKDFRVLMKKFHHVSTSFLELGSSYQKVIKDVSMMIGAGMANFLYKEDLKFEKNSIKAVHCLNEMITNALIHVDDCLKYISAVQHPTIFQSCAMTQIVAIGTLTSCYNNIQVFRGVENMRFGLAPKAVDGSKTISDFYGVFYDFTCVLKSKIDDNDPNATKTKERVEAILNTLQELRNLKTEGSKQGI